MDTPLRCTARPDPGGSTRGVSAERFETPLVGGAAWFWRRGGNPPAPACPRRGKRERGGIQIPCCRRRLPPGLPPEVALRRSLPQVFTATRKPEFPVLETCLGVPKLLWEKELVCAASAWNRKRPTASLASEPGALRRW